MSRIPSNKVRQTISTTDTAKVVYLHSLNTLEYWYCSYLQLLRALVAVGSSVFGEMRARERDRAGVRTYARSCDISKLLFTSHHTTPHHITATANTTVNNTQYTNTHDPQTKNG
jgi:hypothetical protein